MERFTRRLITRQRELYAADLPFADKWRTAMHFLVGCRAPTVTLFAYG